MAGAIKKVTISKCNLITYPRSFLLDSFCFQTTGITGLAVAKNPEHNLRVLYGKILKVLKKAPPNAAYRKYTEEIVQTRLQAVIDVSIEIVFVRRTGNLVPSELYFYRVRITKK